MNTCNRVILVSLATSCLYTVRPSSAYHSYNGFVSTIESLAGPILELDRSYKSIDGNVIYHTKTKPQLIKDPIKTDPIKILLVFGMHPREHITIEAAIAFLRLISDRNCSHIAGRQVARLLEHVSFSVIPMLNPDGQRLLEQSGDECWRGNSNAVDLNRNFDWEWGGPGSSGVRGDEEYRGRFPFSEPETIMIRDLVLSQGYRAVFDVHSGARQMFYGFVDSESPRIQRSSENAMSEQRVIDRILSREYIVSGGVGYKFNDYAADGTLMDWASGVAKVPYSFTIEAFGQPNHDGCFDAFNPAPGDLNTVIDQVQTTLIDAVAIIVEMDKGALLEVNEGDHDDSSGDVSCTISWLY